MSTYLDNSATTKPLKAVANKVYEMLLSNFGNPSSFHSVGINAMLEVKKTRELIADSLSCSSEEIIFTSGGTEANNLAIFGTIEANKRKGKRIVTTAIEHESVLQTCDLLENQGYEVIRIMPDKFGNINEEDIIDAINGDTILVTIMYVNNEVGSITPINSIKNAVIKAKSPAYIHVDCVQAYGKMNIKPAKIGADLVTITAHKIHGPKGVGALYIKKGVRIVPRIYGGEQEQKLRSGTEATPLIAGFGTAVENIGKYKKDADRIKELNTYLKKELTAIKGVKMNNDDNASPYILNAYIPTFMTSQTIVQHLSAQYQIYVSNGSACAKGKKSHVLTAMNLDNNTIEKSIRISFSAFSTKEDADNLISAIKEIVNNYPEK